MSAKRKLVDEIVAASFEMPDAKGHCAWLCSLDDAALRSRLERLLRERENPPVGGGRNWLDAARRRALAAKVLADSQKPQAPPAQSACYDPGI